jgi:hypothetical protein
LQFFDEFFGNFGIGLIVGQGVFDQGNAFFSNNDMGAISPVKDLILFGAVDILVGVIAKSGSGISFRFFFFIGGVAIAIFKGVIFGGCHNRFGIHDKSVPGYHIVFDQLFIDPIINVLQQGIVSGFEEAIELAFIRQAGSHVKTAALGNNGMTVPIVNEWWNSFDLFERLNNKGW